MRDKTLTAFSASIILLLLLISLLSGCGKDTSPAETETATETVTVSESESESESESASPESEVLPVVAKPAGAVTEYTPYDEDRDYIRLDVDCIYQNDYGLYNGCEVVSAATVLNYYGFDIPPDKLFDDYMDSGDYGCTNPFEAYIGNPYKERGACGCYAPCVVDTVNKYLNDQCSTLEAVDISDSTIGRMREYIKSGYPVILWGTVDMMPTWVMDGWYFEEDGYINWYNGSHCVVLIGFEGRNFIVSDPLEGIVKYSFGEIRDSYRLVYSQACIIK